MFRTAKYRPDYPPDGFAELSQARDWVLGFVRWYNGEHRHSAINFVTPQERHSGADIQTLKQRTVLYAAARAARPERWRGKTRDWSRPQLVWLNPDQPKGKNREKLEKAA